MAISNKEVKSKIRSIIEAEEQLNYQRRMGETWVDDLKKLKTNWEKPYLEVAPYLLVVFKQSYSHWSDGSRKNHYYSEISASISVGLLLAAIQVRINSKSWSNIFSNFDLYKTVYSLK